MMPTKPKKLVSKLVSSPTVSCTHAQKRIRETMSRRRLA